MNLTPPSDSRNQLMVWTWPSDISVDPQTVSTTDPTDATGSGFLLSGNGSY